MLDLSHHDAHIRQLYTTGTPSLEIARLLDIDLIDVVGRVRAMELQPPGMGVRRNRDALGAMGMMAPRPAPCSADPDPLPASAPVAASPAMAAPQPRRLASPARPTGAPATQARPVPAPVAAAAQPRPAAAPARAAAVPVMMADDDDDDDGVRTLPGRPRGWLMAEAEVEALFARAGQRFQDVILRKRP